MRPGRLATCVLALTLTAGSPPWAQTPRAPHRADGSIAIVNKAPGKLTVLNLRDGSRRVFDVGYLAHEVAAAQRSIFVSNYGSAYIRSSHLTNEPGNTLTVVDVSRTSPHAETVDLGPGRCAPHGLAASRDGMRLYVTCEGHQSILVMDVATRKVLHSIRTNQAGSHMIVVSSDGSRAYVANFWHGTVTVLDLNSRSIVAHVETGAGTEGIGLSADDRFLYTTSVLRDEVVKVDTDTLAIVARRFVGKDKAPIRVAPTPDGRTLVINCANEGKVLIATADGLDVTHEVAVGQLPIGIAVSGSGYAYSANMNDGTISVIDVGRGIVADTLAAGDEPDGIVYIPHEPGSHRRTRRQ